MDTLGSQGEDVVARDLRKKLEQGPVSSEGAFKIWQCINKILIS
jgi:hypothetical protein